MQSASRPATFTLNQHAAFSSYMRAYSGGFRGGGAWGPMPPVASPAVHLVCCMITCHRCGSYQRQSFLICWSVSVYFIRYTSTSYYIARIANCREVYCNRSCLWVCLCVCGSVTTITRNCVHRSSPNRVFR